MLIVVAFAVYTNSQKIEQLRQVVHSKDREINCLNCCIALMVNEFDVKEAWKMANNEYFGEGDPPKIKAEPVK